MVSPVAGSHRQSSGAICHSNGAGRPGKLKAFITTSGYRSNSSTQANAREPADPAEGSQAARQPGPRIEGAPHSVLPRRVGAVDAPGIQGYQTLSAAPNLWHA